MEEERSRILRAFDRLRARLKTEDLEKVLARQSRILVKVQKNSRLRKFTTEVKLFFAMLHDYVKGHYTEVPLKTVLAIAGALLYVLNPLDVIPDFVFAFGFLDDATVIAYCLKLVGSDLERYRQWREEGPELTS